MEIEIFTLADHAADYGNGKLVISGTFDTISGPSFPMVHPNCSLALRIRVPNSEAGNHTFEIKTIGLPNVQPFKGNLSVKKNISAGHSTINLVVNLNSLKFEKPGRYSFEFHFDNEFRSGLSLSVLKGSPSRVAPSNN